MHLAAQSCLSLCDPMNCSLPDFSVHGILQARILWSRLPCPPPGDLPNPGIKLGSSALQAEFLPSEPPGKAWEVNDYSLQKEKEKREEKRKKCIIFHLKKEKIYYNETEIDFG